MIVAQFAFQHHDSYYNGDCLRIFSGDSKIGGSEKFYFELADYFCNIVTPWADLWAFYYLRRDRPFSPICLPSSYIHRARSLIDFRVQYFELWGVNTRPGDLYLFHLWPCFVSCSLRNQVTTLHEGGNAVEIIQASFPLSPEFRLCRLTAHSFEISLVPSSFARFCHLWRLIRPLRIGFPGPTPFKASYSQITCPRKSWSTIWANGVRSLGDP